MIKFLNPCLPSKLMYIRIISPKDVAPKVSLEDIPPRFQRLINGGVVDPAKFVLEERREFLHRFKSGPLNINEEPARTSVRELAAQVNNYSLVLQCCQDRMPDATSRDLLSNFLFRTRALDTFRHTLGAEVVPLADMVITAYERLADYLAQKPTTA